MLIESAIFILFALLVVTYVRLAHREERDVVREFGAKWTTYAAQTPGWIPRLRRPDASKFRPSHP